MTQITEEVLKVLKSIATEPDPDVRKAALEDCAAKSGVPFETQQGRAAAIIAHRKGNGTDNDYQQEFLEFASLPEPQRSAKMRGFCRAYKIDEGVIYKKLREHDLKRQNKTIELVCAKDVKIKPLDWLWKHWLVRGKLQILAGTKGDGKSTAAFSFAATASKGGKWPDGTIADVGNVIIWSGEDNAEDTIVPRLIAMGADLSRIFIISTVTEMGKKRPFDPSIDLADIETAINKFPDGVSLLIIDPLVSAVYEVPPQLGVMYSCFVDASTGAGGDSFAAAIGHLRDGGDIMVVDAIRNIPPKFSPKTVVAEISELCHAYGIAIAHSDAFASGFVTELFIKNGLRHEFIKENKSQLYTNLLGCINSRKIELLDDKKSIQELVNLERRTGFAGKDRIDHPPGCHDDSANVLAGLTSVVREGLAGGFSMELWLRANDPTLPSLAEEKLMTPEQREHYRKRIAAMVKGN